MLCSFFRIVYSTYELPSKVIKFIINLRTLLAGPGGNKPHSFDISGQRHETPRLQGQQLYG